MLSAELHVVSLLMGLAVAFLGKILICITVLPFSLCVLCHSLSSYWYNKALRNLMVLFFLCARTSAQPGLAAVAGWITPVDQTVFASLLLQGISWMFRFRLLSLLSYFEVAHPPMVSWERMPGRQTWSGITKNGGDTFPGNYEDSHHDIQWPVMGLETPVLILYHLWVLKKLLCVYRCVYLCACTCVWCGDHRLTLGICLALHLIFVYFDLFCFDTGSHNVTLAGSPGTHRDPPDSATWMLWL